MGFGEVLLGLVVRERIVERRIDRWRTRLEGDHGLTEAELDTLEPYVEYVSNYSSGKEFALLALLYSPFVLILVVISGFTLLGSVGTIGALLLGGGSSLTGVGSGTFGAIAGFMVLMTLFAVLLIGLVGYVLWRRWKHYTLATEIRSHLTTNPRRLCADDDPLSESREEIERRANAAISSG